MTSRKFSSKDFLDFKASESLNPPAFLSEKILDQVSNDLNPSPWKIFAKLSLIHFFVALLTLSICPQFGFRVLGNGAGLMGAFMSFGPYGCMLACGSFFLGTSVLVASFLLRPEELRQLKKNVFLEVSALAALSIGFFIMIDAANIVFGFALAWLLGSMMTGMAFVEIVFALRMKKITN